MSIVYDLIPPGVGLTNYMVPKGDVIMLIIGIKQEFATTCPAGLFSENNDNDICNQEYQSDTDCHFHIDSLHVDRIISFGEITIRL
jgi:hypothetical protein